MELTNLKVVLKKAIICLYNLNTTLNNLKRIVKDVKDAKTLNNSNLKQFKPYT